MSSSSAAAEDYDALMRGAITISDVTSDEGNAEILHDLKDNNPNLTEIHLTGGNADDAYPVFDVYDTRGLGVLGCFLGRCTSVTDLHFELPEDLSISAIEPFLLELRDNRSIGTLELRRSSYIPRGFFQMLTPFIASNPNLITLGVNCEMDTEQYRSLSAALREGESLKNYQILGLSHPDRYDHEESIIDNIEALKMHPQLEELYFCCGFSLGRNACVAMSELLRQSSGLQKLGLNNNDINDSGIEALMGGFSHCRGLQELHLAMNPSITAAGWRAVAALLEDPNSTLQELLIQRNGINDESAMIFANALAHNNSLEQLYLEFNDADITSTVWDAFAKVLCDTSSVSSTFLSNHTLQRLDLFRGVLSYPVDVVHSLSLNGCNDKTKVAFRKILRHHNDIDMQPLFEWDLKVLPFLIDWFERAADYAIESEGDNRNRKLSAIYQFIRGMPELAIESYEG